jgi:hypothetical protein
MLDDAHTTFGVTTIEVPELFRSPLNPDGVCIETTIEKVPDKVLKNEASYAPLPRSRTVARAVTADDESAIFKERTSDPDEREFEYISLL